MFQDHRALLASSVRDREGEREEERERGRESESEGGRARERGEERDRGRESEREGGSAREREGERERGSESERGNVRDKGISSLARSSPSSHATERAVVWVSVCYLMVCVPCCSVYEAQIVSYMRLRSYIPPFT